MTRSSSPEPDPPSPTRASPGMQPDAPKTSPTLLGAPPAVIAAWLSRPGAPGAIGALMDECARAAEDYCRVVETFDVARFVREVRRDGDPDTLSPRSIARHVLRAAHGYARDIARARGLPVTAFELPDSALATPHEVRPALRDAFVVTERAVDGLHALSERELGALTFQVRWGPTFDPDMLLEHAVCHFLRHRRQLERWG